MPDEKKENVTPEEETNKEPMPVSNNSAASWWNSWVETAKQKSSEVLDFVKKDLDEIATAVKGEATSVVNSTSNVLKETLRLEDTDSPAYNVKKSVSSFFGSVTNALNPLPEDDDQEALVVQNETVQPLTRLQTDLHNLASDKDTYLKEIEEDLQPQYDAWYEVSEEALSTEKLTKILMANSELHNQYEALVPEEVSHITFWKRYLFRKALLEDEEVRRQAKEKREQQIAEEIQWEKQDFAPELDISEEDQIRLLTEYEKERSKDVKTKEVKDASETVSSQVSSADTDDWEKDFDLEEANQIE